MAKVNNGVEELSEKQFDDFVKKDLVLIDFFAEWCMPCVMMAPVIDELSHVFKGKIDFGKINVDDNQNLAQKFDVMSIPTLIVFKEGKEVQRITGALQQEQLEEKLNGFVK